MSRPQDTTRPMNPEAVTGVQLAQGIGHQPAKGFWGEAWSQVVKRPGALFGLTWITIIAFFAIFAPFLASGHPLILSELDEAGNVVTTSYPLFAQLKATDVLLLLGLIAAIPFFLLPLGIDRSTRIALAVVLALQAMLASLIATAVRGYVTGRDVSDAVRNAEQAIWFPWAASFGCVAIAVLLLFWLVPLSRGIFRFGTSALVGAVVAVVIAMTWSVPLESFDYRQREAKGEISAVYTLIPLSPQQGDTVLDLAPPSSNLLAPAIKRLERSSALRLKDDDGNRVPLEDIPLTPEILDAAVSEIQAVDRLLPVHVTEITTSLSADYESGSLKSAQDLIDWINARDLPAFVIGTDSLGQDVLSQMLHACRLSISIGLVSTGIAVIIGVTIGALMGYFGGWVDLLLYRIVEIFMAIPVLFLLIVAAAVLPRNTYVMMIIIGCVTWTGAARFVRAEFYKLRNQDFVQSAKAVGLPLRSILFKHMLPNGVTPVLVDSSFAIAAAILAEAVLSFLGLGPANQASWGRLLSDATNQVGDFVWWLAIFPGAAIFLTVLAYNLIGEALRDAIDPKLKKARV